MFRDKREAILEWFASYYRISNFDENIGGRSINKKGNTEDLQ